ncbi:flagellar hook-associated protein FlgL [Nocardioides sp. Kera G14]|uniref:flagellar hook-associated protein FlgL n=1 Tax=Nocardioides sp. Kera G14 TaxID=2884264 RepID=UPI001D11E33A|nr:flagellar hook-associated protein FlgL [Nocardioides sp. Kera G14]UDY24089.1 flagellar hook-associated protein FlgL [Nocardioides sp. Kera G14]
MAITRVTQQMLSNRSMTAVMSGLSRMSKYEEQLETGKKLNRPSDDPAGTNTALRVRSALAEQTQYGRNAEDGQAWLSTIDSTLSGITDQIQRANTLALQGANSGSMSQASRDSIASELDQIRESVLQSANTDYLGRPVFGGTTSGSVAYNDDGTYAGDDGEVLRRVGSGVQVRVDSRAQDVFGPDDDNIFKHLSDLATALSSTSSTDSDEAIQEGIANLQADLTRITSAQSDEGARMNRLTKASDLASQATLQLQTSLSDVEDADLAETTLNVQQSETAYQAALAATGKTLQPSLLDFLS